MPEKRAQESYAEELSPSRISLGQSFSGKRTKLVARVYADAEFQRETLGWEDRFRALVFRANEQLGPAFGIELVLAEVRTWTASRELTGLEATLDELTRLDEGTDVDLVFALVTSLPLVTSTVHHLGMASRLGKHVVLRAMDDAGEREALARALDMVSSAKQEKLYVDRLHHKELAVFLHELGHLFGAIHESDSDSLMSVFYSHEESRFSGANLALMKLVLEARKDSRELVLSDSLKAQLAAELEKKGSFGWIESERKELLDFLNGVARPRPSSAEAMEAEPKTDEDRVRRAVGLSPTNPKGAWVALEPVADAKPEDVIIQRLACELLARTDPKSESAIRRCKALVGLDKVDPDVGLLAGGVLLLNERFDEAIDVLRDAQFRIEKIEVAGSVAASPEANAYGVRFKSSTPAELWVRLMRLYQSASCATLAEGAATHSGDSTDAKEVVDWASKLRQQHSVPPDAWSLGLSPELEGRYFRARDAIWRDVAAQNLGSAAERGEALRRDFPKLPGSDVALCEGYYRARKTSKAREHCQRATEREPSHPRPHLYLGFFLLSSGSTQKAARHLERAQQLAPEDEQTWEVLAAAYRSAGEGAKLERLRADFALRFGKRMK